MARLRPLSPSEVSPEVARRLEGSARVFGEPLVSTGIQAHCPPILEASQALGSAPARSGTLPALVRSLVCLRVAQIVGCPF
jgi:alkylhydroperoxidase family enzyme